MIGKALRFAFFILIVRPFCWLVLGMRVRNRPNLPKDGPAIIASNHNSHLDTIVLMALMPLKLLPKVHPAAAADYWHANRWITWFADTIIGIVPVYRKGEDEAGDPLEHCYKALDRGEILIYFPEGSRGTPEKMGKMKFGLAKLMAHRADTSLTPVFLNGLGKAWPRGSGVIVPFVCDVFIGEPLYYRSTHKDIIRQFKTAVRRLSQQGEFPELILSDYYSDS